MTKPYRKGSAQRRVGKGDDSYREIDIFDGTTISEGGWYSGKSWMTAADAEAARHRWYMARDAESPHDKDHWVEHQCGGCRWFGAFDADWGLCWNAASPQDGRIMFEHNGCAEHSYIVSKRAEDI